jgi:hypothetical protein
VQGRGEEEAEEEAMPDRLRKRGSIVQLCRSFFSFVLFFGSVFQITPAIACGGGQKKKKSAPPAAPAAANINDPAVQALLAQLGAKGV